MTYQRVNEHVVKILRSDPGNPVNQYAADRIEEKEMTQRKENLREIQEITLGIP